MSRIFVNFLKNIASEKRNSAAYSGSYSDGGARELETQIAVYMAGLSGKIPMVWSDYLKEFNKTNDPEYQKYIELKKKFE